MPQYRIEFEIFKELGRLSKCDEPIEFNIVKWDNVLKYDLRRWGMNENGIQPYKGIVFDLDQLEVVHSLMRDALAYQCDYKAKWIVRVGNGNARVYQDFGTFGKSGRNSKHITCTSFGNGCKTDLRLWGENFSSCLRGVSLSRKESELLLELIQKELLQVKSKNTVVSRSNDFLSEKNELKESSKNTDVNKRKGVWVSWWEP